jgi:hypothetical protein
VRELIGFYLVFENAAVFAVGGFGRGFLGAAAVCGLCGVFRACPFLPVFAGFAWARRGDMA